MNVVGICGKAGAGKDTIADWFGLYGYQKIALADPIKRLVKDIFVLNTTQVYDRIEREKDLENWPTWTVRKLLQKIGTELFREQIDDSIWVKSLYYRIRYDEINYVIPDIRFPNELDFLKTNIESPNKFISIKVIREGCNGSVGLANHKSEAYDLTTDYTILNDGTIQDLYIKLAKLGDEIL